MKSICNYGQSMFELLQKPSNGTVSIPPLIDIFPLTLEEIELKSTKRRISQGLSCKIESSV